MPKPFSVFISYSHEDTELCEGLKNHLSSLKTITLLVYGAMLILALGQIGKSTS